MHIHNSAICSVRSRAKVNARVLTSPKALNQFDVISIFHFFPKELMCKICLKLIQSLRCFAYEKNHVFSGFFKIDIILNDGPGATAGA